MVDSSDDEPSGERRVFGAGIKRKRIDFVRAQRPCVAAAAASASRPSLSERYLAITLKDSESHTAGGISHGNSELETEGSKAPDENAVCEVCKVPLNETADPSTSVPRTHEGSLAHQLCLQHSYPPSHLDRNRHGLKYLSSYGWDPNERLGLGASGEGIKVPIKAKVKNDTLGLGVKVPERKNGSQRVVEKLDAKGVRKKEAEEKRKGKRLRQMFYASDDVERYLGDG